VDLPFGFMGLVWQTKITGNVPGEEAFETSDQLFHNWDSRYFLYRLFIPHTFFLGV